MTGPQSANVKVVLFESERTANRAVAMTTTDAGGTYVLAGLMPASSSSWYVEAPSVEDGLYSRTVYERIALAIRLRTFTSTVASTTIGYTHQPVVFGGHVTPTPQLRDAWVHVQEQVATQGDDWRTIGSSPLDSSSDFSVPYRFLAPGLHYVRAIVGGDAANSAGTSSTIGVMIEQRQHRAFTIGSASAYIHPGEPDLISGVLRDAPRGTALTLWSRGYGQRFVAVARTATASKGAYSFSVAPIHNAVYYVRTTGPIGGRAGRTRKVVGGEFVRTAWLDVGVSDLVELTRSTSTGAFGDEVVFTGSVSPDKAGHVVELQLRRADGKFHTVATGYLVDGCDRAGRASLGGCSAYSISWALDVVGNLAFGVRSPGDRFNVSGVSASADVHVAAPAATGLDRPLAESSPKTSGGVSPRRSTGATG